MLGWFSYSRFWADLVPVGSEPVDGRSLSFSSTFQIKYNNGKEIHPWQGSWHHSIHLSFCFSVFPSLFCPFIFCSLLKWEDCYENMHQHICLNEKYEDFFWHKNNFDLVTWFDIETWFCKLFIWWTFPFIRFSFFLSLDFLHNLTEICSKHLYSI